MLYICYLTRVLFFKELSILEGSIHLVESVQSTARSEATPARSETGRPATRRKLLKTPVKMFEKKNKSIVIQAPNYTSQLCFSVRGALKSGSNLFPNRWKIHPSVKDNAWHSSQRGEFFRSSGRSKPRQAGSLRFF